MCPNIRCDGVKSFWVGTKQGLNMKLHIARRIRARRALRLLCSSCLLVVRRHVCRACATLRFYTACNPCYRIDPGYCSRIGPPVAAVHVVCSRERSPPPLLRPSRSWTRVSSGPLIRAAPAARACVPLLSCIKMSTPPQWKQTSPSSPSKMYYAWWNGHTGKLL
jgi:hypothetical protein